MTKERELLRRALRYFQKTDCVNALAEDIEHFLSTPSDDAEEPVAWLASYPDNPDLGSWFCHTNFADYEGVKCEPLYLHAPKPEPEAEPVKFLYDATRFKVTGSKAEGMIYGLPQNLIGKWVAFVDADNGQHLKYTRPSPSRKPMTKEEIARGFYSGRWLYEDFEAGVRFAEKHHEIGDIK